MKLLIKVLLILSLSAPAGALVIEAEDMTIKQCATNSAVTDGWVCKGPGKLAESATFKKGKVDLQIVARGDYAGGAWPIMEVKIGGNIVGSISVDSATWKIFEIKAVETTAGAQEISVDFINDWYVKTEDPPDRNFYLDKITIIEIPEIQGTARVTVAWDANTEADLAGYKIHYGTESRFNITVDAIKEWCLEHEPTNEKCIAEWNEICSREGDFDPVCHSMLYQYENVVDVKTNSAGWDPGCIAPYDPFKAACCEYTLTGLEAGTVYYLAAIAYDTGDNESHFSKELKHYFPGADPASPEGLRQAVIAPAFLKITGIFPDPIKENLLEIKAISREGK